MNQPAASVLHGADHYGLRPDASEFPMMLVLSFVYPCNALCPHCPYTNSNIRKEYRDAPYMPEATFKKIADESGRCGAYAASAGDRALGVCQGRRLQDWPDHQWVAVRRDELAGVARRRRGH